MGYFSSGAHFFYTTELGPNERFGIEPEDSFQKLALELEGKNNRIKQQTQKE